MCQYQLANGHWDNALPREYVGKQRTYYKTIPLALYRVFRPYSAHPLSVLPISCVCDVLQNVVKLLLAVKIKLFLTPDVSEEDVLIYEVVRAGNLVPLSLHGLLLRNQSVYLLL